MNLSIKSKVFFSECIKEKAALIALLTSMSFGLLASETSVSTTSAGSEAGRTKTKDATTEVAIEAPDNDIDEEGPARKDCPYLGIATTEASEALAAQLGLREGAGLVVTYVVPDSPAAKAGLQKHDVLVRLGEQWLVHPAQLRKLVQVHKKENEMVALAFYRAGKEQTASVTLGRRSANAPGEPQIFDRRIEEFDKDSEERSIDQAVHDSLRHLNKDRKSLHQEIHRSMEEVRAAIKEAFRDVTDVASDLDPVRRILRELNHSGVQVDKKATVTVRSAGKGVKSVVKTDDLGTIVIVQNPKAHLTAHDKEGKLLFDGEIETAEQRAKVSREIRERVEPLLDKMGD